jgi:hypothetical protein
LRGFISEGALVNILSARQRFAAATAAIRAKLLSGTVICSSTTVKILVS